MIMKVTHLAGKTRSNTSGLVEHCGKIDVFMLSLYNSGV